MIRMLYLFTLSFLGMIILHAAIILAIPKLLPNNAMDHYGKKEFYYNFFRLNKNDPSMKTSDPFFDIAVCSFDLSQGPVKLFSPIHTKFWSLSIYDNKGVNRYSLNSEAAFNASFNLLIVNSYQMISLNNQKENLKQKSIVLDSDFKQGFVILRSFIDNNLPNEKQKGKLFLQSAICRPFF